MSKKTILFTFDYELFLGLRSGSVENCLLRPVREMAGLLGEYGAKGIFFVDATYLLRLEEVAIQYPAAAADREAINDQLRSLLLNGHYLFPHIHAHWQDATYLPEKNQWELRYYRKYRFHSLSTEERGNVFNRSCKILGALIKSVKADYQMDAFRAGGWSIQPFVDFLPHFKQWNIKYDFSVLPGFTRFSEVPWYDFSAAPSIYPYRFGDDLLQIAANGAFTEFPISAVPFSTFMDAINRIYLKWRKFMFADPQGDGIGVYFHAQQYIGRMQEMIAVELLTPVKLPAYRKFLNTHDYMQFISHPKMFTVYNINTFRRFLEYACKHYAVETDFRKLMI